MLRHNIPRALHRQNNIYFCRLCISRNLTTVAETDSTTDIVQPIPSIQPVPELPKKQEIKEPLSEKERILIHKQKKKAKSIAGKIRKRLSLARIPSDDALPDLLGSTDTQLDKILSSAYGVEEVSQPLEQPFSQADGQVESEVSKAGLSIRELLKKDLDKPNAILHPSKKAKKQHRAPGKVKLVPPKENTSEQAPLIRRIGITREGAYSPKELAEIKLKDKEAEKIANLNLAAKTDQSLRHVYGSSTEGHELKRKLYGDDDLHLC